MVQCDSLDAGGIRPYASLTHPWGGGGKEKAMTQLKIEGMTCGHCVMSVKQALEAVPGVEGPVAVDLKSGSATVGGAADPAALLAAVAEEGYTATLAR